MRCNPEVGSCVSETAGCEHDKTTQAAEILMAANVLTAPRVCPSSLIYYLFESRLEEVRGIPKSEIGGHWTDQLRTAYNAYSAYV